MSDLNKLPILLSRAFGVWENDADFSSDAKCGGRRLAVVVNEFGDVGVDGEILKSCSIPDCPRKTSLNWPMDVFAARWLMILSHDRGVDGPKPAPGSYLG